LTSTDTNKNKKTTDTSNSATDKIEIDNNQVEDIKATQNKQSENKAECEEKAKPKKAHKTASEKRAEELAVERDKYLRLAAEYKNFRDRSTKEREMTYIDARMDTIAKLLPVYDNLERALKMECSDEAFYKGVEMTMTGLLEIFESMDVKPIPAVGEPFDPNHHNAIMVIENPNLGSKIVAEELQKGFILGDKVIRFSTVVVAN
jgi:molecular chaperone GrpE